MNSYLITGTINRLCLNFGKLSYKEFRVIEISRSDSRDNIKNYEHYDY
ncbi:MAG: hypothetical protein JXR48_17310 [Candidatus Delongbacteria bacterium]|nr:hypothetical protein [Candidatus Delongbacteria bacterium]MBN2836718.1 hypothetical protein [Candidatus Delongbacteria bacterium]